MKYRIVMTETYGGIISYDVEKFQCGIYEDYWKIVHTTNGIEDAKEYVESRKTPKRTVIKEYN